MSSSFMTIPLPPAMHSARHVDRAGLQVSDTPATPHTDLRLVDEARREHGVDACVSPDTDAQVASQRAAVTRDTLQATERELEHPREACETGSAREFEQYVDSIMDGLTPLSAIPIPSDVIPHSPECDGPSDHNELLRELLVSKPAGRHIFLDSVCPDVAPHIIVTPPSDPVGAYWSYFSNWTPPQSEDFLTVYPRSPSDNIGDSYVEINDDAAWDSLEHDYHNLIAQQPQVTSGFARLRRNIEIQTQHQPTVDFLTVHKQSLQAAVLEASHHAHVFRSRWDIEDIPKQIEKSFQWIDPAEPLLVMYSQDRNARIIDSAEPFRTPHIVVHEAPEQTPWEIYQNCPPPQDCAGGYYLTVFSDGYLCPSCPPRPPSPEPEEQYILEDQCLLDEAITDVDFDEIDSESDSSLDTVITPTDSLPAPMELPLDKYDSPPSFALDEDEDDLPPFDDWYQSIAQRTSSSL